MSVSKVGDLVWVRVQGHPWWPGQVLPLLLVLSPKRPHAALIVVMLALESHTHCFHLPPTLYSNWCMCCELGLQAVCIRTGYGPQESHK